MLNVNMQQLPVGQGGFMVGEIDAGGQPTRWFYDCGSNQMDHLAREIERAPTTADLLFISHLHDDHVNGIDTLLLHCDVEEVVMPYLNDWGRLLAVAQAAASGRVTGNFLSFMADPAAWLGDRGVDRLTYVRGRRDGDDDGDDGDGAIPDDPKPREGHEEAVERLRPKWTRRDPAPLESTTREGCASVSIAPIGALISLASSSGAIDWVLLPQAYAPSKARMIRFGNEVLKRFPGLNPREVAQEAKTATGRAKLQACYDMLWKDHNLVSMSLYAGPASIGNGTWHRSDWSQSGWHGLSESVGWLSTGDADLSGSRRRKAFERFYAAYLDKVVALMAPHHGSALSWHPTVLNGFTNLEIGFAAAGPNGYGHPHQSVRDDIEAHGLATFVQVSERPISRLILQAHKI